MARGMQQAQFSNPYPCIPERVEKKSFTAPDGSTTAPIDLPKRSDVNAVARIFDFGLRRSGSTSAAPEASSHASDDDIDPET